MKINDKYWSGLYEEGRTRWDLGSIAPPLKIYFDALKDKNIKILIPGAGNAYEAEYLFSKGFKNVFVLDWASEPLEGLKRRSPKFPDENLVCGDFFKHTGKYDLVVEHVFFCAIEPKLRKKYGKKVSELLNPCGKFVGILFDDELKDVEEGPPFGGTKKEYLEYFKPYFEISKYAISPHSVKPRLGRELFCIFEKKRSGDLLITAK